MRKEARAEQDWDRQLDSVVNNESLRAISRRYERERPRSDGSPISGALASIENRRRQSNDRSMHVSGGRLQVIAAKLGTRPRAVDDAEDWARIVETRVSRRLHQIVADSSSVTVRAVDALRSHLESLSDEVSASNNALLRCQKSLSALERRVGLLEEDVGNELLRLRNHVNAREDAFQSVLQRVQGQIDSLSESSEKIIAERVERQISDSLQPFQRNLVETIAKKDQGGDSGGKSKSQGTREELDLTEARNRMLSNVRPSIMRVSLANCSNSSSTLTH